MDEIAKAIQRSTDLKSVAELLYGDAAFEVVKSLTQKKEAPKKTLVAKALSKEKLKEIHESDTHRKLKMVKLGTDAAFTAVPVVAAKTKQQLERVGKSTDMDIHWQGEISKMDEDKRQVFGWASILEIDGKPVVDLQGDVMELDTVENAAYEYVIKSRKGGNQHERDGDGPRHVSDLVESFVVTPEKREQMGLPDSVPTGWWIGFKVNDDETWGQVKDGSRKEFSIHGKGVRKNVEVDY